MAPRARAAAVRRLGTSLRTGHADAAVVAVGAAGAFVLLIVVLRAAALNQPEYIDPWIYTGLFEDWDYMYRTFGDYYYASRLPYLIPGYAVHSIFSPVVGFYVLHWGFLLLGATSAYWLLRHYFGRPVAMIGYAVALTNVLYFDAHSNDYYDGAVIAYLFLAFFLIMTARDARRPGLRTAAGGFALAGAVTTNLFAALPVACMAAAYAAVNWPRLRERPVATLTRDAGLLVGGAAAMVTLCGLFSVVKGGSFLYFMTQVRYAGNLGLSQWKFNGYGWLLDEPKLLVAPLLVASFAVLIRRPARERWHHDASLRFAVGVVAYLAIFFAALTIWEFAFDGIFFEIVYYFSYITTGFVLGCGAVCWLVIRSGTPTVVVLAAAVAALPAVLVSTAFPWHAFFSQDHGPLIAAVLVAAALAAAALARRTRVGSMTALALVLLVASVNFASAASRGGWAKFQTTPESRDRARSALALSVDFIGFMKASGAQASTDSPPAFWYDIDADAMHNALQSLYLWQTTWIGLDMPHFGPEEAALLRAKRPETLVLLCLPSGCGDAANVVRRAGFELRNGPSTVIEYDGHRVRVETYRMPEFIHAHGPAGYYEAIQTPLSGDPGGSVLAAWSFANGVPSAFHSEAREVTAMQGAVEIKTAEARFGYTLEGDARTLPPGSYGVTLDGRVLSGGMQLGILDDDAQRWLAQSSFWSGQRGWDQRRMVVRFELAKPTRIRIMLTNLRPKDGISTWRLARLALVRLK